jgi:membrane protease YdiL (CAAX protease family)
LYVLITATRRRLWRDPLADATPPLGPPALAVLAAFLLFVAVHGAVGTVLLRGIPAEEVVRTGSPAWHRAQLAGNVAALLVTTYMAVALSRVPPTGVPCGVRRGVPAMLLALLTLMPLMTLQSEAGRVLWSWFHPEVTPPVHMVLLALRDTAWGDVGRAQLALGAVLLAPLSEELFFRGLVLGALAYHTRRTWIAITVSAIMFGFVHAQPQDVTPLITMGLVLGYLRVRCAALWPCVLLHMLFNLRTITLALLAPEMIE